MCTHIINIGIVVIAHNFIYIIILHIMYRVIRPLHWFFLFIIFLLS